MPLRKYALSGRFGRHERENENVAAVVCKGVILSLIDILLTFLVGAVVFYLLAGYIVAPIERGFYCNDVGIRKPLLPHTISPKQLLIVTLGVPLITVFFCEAVFFARFNNTKAKLRKYFSSSTGIILAYLLSYTVGTIVMEVGKCGVGRLRPHFLEACLPDWTKVDCTTDPTAFITDAHCTNEPHAVRVGRGSFPSGHSAAAVLALSFLYFYLTEVVAISRPRAGWLWTVRAAVLVVFSVWTAVCLVTRITDCWHHPTDVLGGILLGFVCVYLPFGRSTREQAMHIRLLEAVESGT